MVLAVVVFGHSFVHRLESYILADPAVSNLGLSGELYNVQLFGIGGLKLAQSRRLHCKDSELRNRDVAFLEIGSNDLCDQRYQPDVFARDLVAFAEYLKLGLGVGKVIISQILPRRRLPYTSYNDNVIKANVAVEEMVCHREGIFFWKHRGMWHCAENIYCRDGIHLSDSTGNRKYLRSVRDSIIRCSHWSGLSVKK